MMLVEYLDDASKEIGEIKRRAHEMRKKYDEIQDRDLLMEIASLNKKIKVKRHNIWETIYENVEEFRFMKRHFPQLFQVYSEDDAIGRIIRKKEWLAGFSELNLEESLRKLVELRKEINTLKELKAASKAWKEPFREEMFGNAWKLLKDRVTEKTDRHELGQITDEEIKKRRKHGWAILLNDPFILKYINRFLERLKNAMNNEDAAKRKMEQSKGQGTYWEYKAKQELNRALVERKRTERLCRHLLLSNPAYLEKFKRQGMVWRNREIAEFMKKFLNEMRMPHINEREWVREMRKKIES